MWTRIHNVLTGMHGRVRIRPERAMGYDGISSMLDASPTTVYDYSSEQAEVNRLYERFRRCLVDQKYYARRLSLYQRWDTGTNLFAGFAMLLSLATRTSEAWVSNASYALGALAALVFIGKPIFKVSEQIEKYTILHCGFGELFARLEHLLADIRRNEGITVQTRQCAEELIEKYDALALREDASINWRQVEKIQSDVDKSIPKESLWLPSK